MKSISAAAIALSLLIGSTTGAHADARGDGRHDRGYDPAHREYREAPRPQRHDDRQDNHDYGDRDRDGSKFDSQERDYRRGYQSGRYDAGRYIRPRGYYQHSWRRGERLPAAYYSNRYVVRNFSTYRLHQPPRGYHWVRVDGDAVLAAVATGAIVSIVAGLFH